MPFRFLAILFALAAISARPAFAAEEAAKAAPTCDPDTGVCTLTPPGNAAGGRQMWAQPRLFTDAPPLEVQKWLTGKPETDGKFIVLEFWRTWCGACKRTTPFLNEIQKKHGDELVVIAVTGESEKAVNAYSGPKLEYTIALDFPQPQQADDEAAKKAASRAETEPVAALPDQASGPAANRPGQGRYEAQFGVWGWPHVIILEPQYRTIVWEGFPGLKGYELTEAKVEKMLAIGRSSKRETAAPKDAQTP